jgi:signal transduction histidine kinase
MNANIATEGDHNTAGMNDNRIMTSPAGSSMLRIVRTPFNKRSWVELGYMLATLPISIASTVFTVATLANPPLWVLSVPGLRKLADANRYLARELLGEDVPAPPLPGSELVYKVRTSSGARLAGLAQNAKAKARAWETKPGVTIRNLTPARITELAAQAGIEIDHIEPANDAMVWFRAREWDPAAWRTRLYFVIKLPLAAASVAINLAGWLGGVFCLSFPVWWGLEPGLRLMPLGAAITAYPLSGALLLMAGTNLMHGAAEADRRLVRSLLGSSSPADRIRTLEESRARAVDDSAARLRGIERDLHDGTQAQLVALAMKLGLAREKLEDGDLTRLSQLVDDAHRGVLEAITDLRTLARGIHPPVLDNGLADALGTLATRSAVPVELVVDIPERPSAAIETIAYFSVAELLTNIAKHSGARHATVEAVHVPGLLRIRVTDDGAGGARMVPGGGLHGLAERIRTVDGRLEISSPPGGSTTITVELPSHA